MTGGRGEDGFTVIELLISMLILIVLTTPLVASFVLGIRTTQTGDQDATNSADAQLLASYLHADVAGAEVVGASSGCGGSSSFLTLEWSQGGGTRHVAYRTLQDAGVQADLGAPTPVYRLERLECDSSSGPVVRTVQIGRTLTSVPVVSCDSSACATGTPRTVSVQVTTFGRPAADSSAQYTYSVTAARKVVP